MAKKFSERNENKTVVQAALLEMRKVLDLSQQDLATKFGKPLTIVARWETSRPPRGIHLALLHNFARESSIDHPSLIRIANIFSRAMEQGNEPKDLSIQETIFVNSFVTLLRERHLTDVDEQCTIAVKAIHAGYKALLKHADRDMIRHIKLVDAKEEYAALNAEIDQGIAPRVRLGDGLLEEQEPK